MSSVPPDELAPSTESTPTTGAPLAPTTTDAVAIAAVVVGVLSLFLSLLCLGLLLGPVTVILGAIAFGRARSRASKGVAGSGIALPVVGIVLGIVSFVVSAVALNAALHYCTPGYACNG